MAQDPRGANRASPMSPTFSGWFNDRKDSRLSYYYNGTKVGHLDASGFSITQGTIMTNGVLQAAGLATPLKIETVRLGTTAAVASGGSNAILPDVGWVVPLAYTNGITIVEAYRQNISASDVTTGTATSSASYRRVNLITNVTGTGSGTTIIASQNATASLASLVTRAFAVTTASTVAAGALILASHLTVGAATADGTDMAASIFELVYQIL